MTKTYFYLIPLVLLLFSCSQKQPESIEIDLSRKQAYIPYSFFVDSVKNITLTTETNLFISNVEKLFIDGDWLFIEAPREGVLVFSLKEGKLLNVINYFGQGPGEFTDIISSTIDKQKKQVLIFSYPSLYKYSYTGEFKEKIDNENNFFQDFQALPGDEFICIDQPYSDKYPCGVWLADKNLQYLKSLKPTPATENFRVLSRFHNQAEKGIYYYDPAWDDLSFITRDSVINLYNFDLKQRLPTADRAYQNPPNMGPYAYLSSFSHSTRFILIGYFWLNQRDPKTWVLLDRESNKTYVSNVLQNDINGLEATSGKLFHVDDHTWCRILDFEEDSADLKIELLFLKS